MARRPLYYTFGNHMHWTDMQWLWGYGVLPGSVRDMLALIEATGARGNVNFDGIGYEKLAVEAPGALADLRAAVQDGRVEVVGGSYGQPYGLFHGGESNVRQLVYGVRSVQRLLGVRPRAFWEEEFYFFPQLPQLLAGCGYDGVSLFFQWTWHTPTVPEEPHALIQWEGLDGTRLFTLPKNELCLHQWPEDFEGRLESPLLDSLPLPALVQWLELLPSPDWMCRSELILPRLRELAADERFELRPRTLSELIAELREATPEVPLRRYTMDDVFHGMSLGKNGDYMPRYSRTAEEQLLAAESLSALLGLLGRPYPHWDVYPTWELEEAWRELLTAQHHDVHECEGLCGFVGERSFERSVGLSGTVFARGLEHLAARVDALEGSTVVFNPLGWTRDVVIEEGAVRNVPAYGYRVVDPYDVEPPRLGEASLEVTEEGLVLERGDLRAVIERGTGCVKELRSAEFPEGVLAAGRSAGDLHMIREGRPERFERASVGSDLSEEDDFAEFGFVREGRGGSRLRVSYGLAPLHDALWIRFQAEELARPDGGMHAGLSTGIAPSFAGFELLHDHPYGITPVRADRDHVRKYPSGDWMTSEQWFEDVRRPFTSSSLLDLIAPPAPGAAEGRGLLLIHDGSQAMFRGDDGVRVLLNMYDPWDEEHWDPLFEAELFLMPHGALTNTERMRASMELNLGTPRFEDSAVVRGGGDLPPLLGALAVDAPNVLATAFYRESERAAEHLPQAFARGVRDPFVLRLVELDGRPADVLVRVPGPVAKAARTNLMGELLEPLTPTRAQAPFGPAELPWSALRLSLRPHEIATVMLDLELGRAVPRNLDEHRHVWAGVHRRGGA